MMFERLRRHIPTREQLVGNRWLRWLGPLLHHPRLWHWSRRGVATGVGIGVFFGLLVPIAQIPLSAVAAIALRANVPAAAVSTLISNPVTFAPIYYAAYKLGTWVTGGNPEAITEMPSEQGTAADRTLWQRIGLPLLIGLAITATLAGLASYVLISLGWYWRVMWRRRQKTDRTGRSP